MIYFSLEKNINFVEENGEKDLPKINVNNLDQNESILENKQQ